MPASSRSLVESRRDQMFPTLAPAEIERLRCFGETRSYRAGDYLATTGAVGLGMVVILAGEVAITQRDELAGNRPIVTHGQGSFMGELAQLSGRPALVDARAQGAVEALVIPPHRLRDVMVREADLGERIMRALILRRMNLLEFGAGGPVIVGRAGDGDALRLPVVLCPGGQLLRNPGEVELARCIGLVGPIDPDKVYDVAIVGAGPAGLAAAVYAGSEGLATLV